MSREVIEAAARLISDPEKWCQGALARSKKGLPTTPLNASSWDAIGAVYHVMRTPVHDTKPPRYGDKDVLAITLATIQLVATVQFRMSIERVNDERGHADVMHVLRTAWKMADPEADDRKEAA